MLFSSAIFIFAFLPAAILIYFLLPKILQNIFLLIISLLFYAWGEPVYVLLMIVSITINYLIGNALGRVSDKYALYARMVLTLGIIFNSGLLYYYKYFWFTCQSLNDAFGWNIGTYKAVAMPIGISFYTFQSLSYLMDVYRKEVKAQGNIINLGLYISFFPQLIAGPIVRYHDVNEQIERRKVDLTGFAYGIERFIIGLAKKVLLANTLGEVADRIFEYSNEQIAAPTAWLGIVCYALQIFFDFSGYSDMAIGLGKMLGFSFRENFNYPYLSKSIREFWQRWHISLSTWFRDYLYIPLGGNKKSQGRTYFNLILVFFITGLWHGANWNFVFWGLFHGCFLILERNRLGAWLNKAWTPVQHAYTLLVVLVGWVFFRTATMADAFKYLKAMAGLNSSDYYPRDITEFTNPKVWTCLVLALIFSTPVTTKYFGHDRPRLTMAKNAVVLLFLIFILILSVADIASDSYNPFIYFRF